MSNNYITKNKLTKKQLFSSYVGASLITTILTNPITTYRQLVQQYAKNDIGTIIEPKLAVRQVKDVFIKSPISASLSGLVPRIIGVNFKTVPKFGFLWGITHLTGGVEPGIISAIGASIFSSYCINPIRVIEKQQRIDLKKTGKSRKFISIIKEAHSENFKPLFRGTTLLMGHSLASSSTGLVGQPKLQKYIENILSNNYSQEKTFSFSKTTANLIASAFVSPIYIVMTNPISRLEVIMQTAPIKNKEITISEALKELLNDGKYYGIRGVFRGQGLGILKAILTLSLFHESRMFCEKMIEKNNL